MPQALKAIAVLSMFCSYQLAALAEPSQYQLHANKSRSTRLNRPTLPKGHDQGQPGQLNVHEFGLTPLAGSKPENLLNPHIEFPESFRVSGKTSVTEQSRTRMDALPADKKGADNDYGITDAPSTLPPPESPSQASDSKHATTEREKETAVATANAAAAAAYNAQVNEGTGNQAQLAGGPFAAGGPGVKGDMTLPQLLNVRTAAAEAQRSGALIWNKDGTLWSSTGKWAMGPDGVVITGRDAASILEKNPTLGLPDTKFAQEYSREQYGPGGYKPSVENTTLMPSQGAVQATVQQQLAR